MTGLDALDMLIGIVLVFCVLSLVCSALVEMYALWTNRRGKMLRDSVETFFWLQAKATTDPRAVALADKFYAHPLISALSSTDRPPAYIPAPLFADTIVAIALEPRPNTPPVGAGLPARVEAVRQNTLGYVGDVMIEALQEHEGDLDAVKARLAQWYNNAMDRLGGTYRRSFVNKWLLIFGAVVAVGTNADTLRMFRVLSDNPAVRAQMVEAATKVVNAGTPDPNAPVNDKMNAARDGLLHVEPILGWTGDPLAVRLRDWVTGKVDSKTTAADGAQRGFGLVTMGASKLVGLFITIIALSLGGPFWFQLLDKLLKLRSSVRPAATNEPTGVTAANAAAGGGEGAAADSAAPSGPTAPTAADLPLPEGSYPSGMRGFTPRTLIESPHNAYWLARLADAAYLDPAAIELQAKPLALRATPLAARSVEIVLAGQKVRVDTQAYTVEDAGTLILAFRGTEKKLSDWATDAHATAVPAKFNNQALGMGHAGFLAGLESVWDAVVTAIRPEALNGRALWITGHSLGGALAMLCAARIKATFGDSPRVYGVYTFGQPRVGDAAFSAWYDGALKDRTYRFVNHRDVVPRVPPRAMGFAESGQVRYINNTGRIVSDPGLWYQLLDTVPVDPDKIKDDAMQLVGDHGMANYVDLLGKRLGPGFGKA